MNGFIIEGTTLVSYKGNEKSITVPDEIRKIGKCAFEDSNIESICFGVSSLLAIIEESAFKNCKHLERIELPAHLSEIGDNAFIGCNSLYCIYVPKTVAFLGKDIISKGSATVLVGCSGSTIEEYARENGITFSTNWNETSEQLNKKNELQGETATKEFDIFNEIIVCSNTYPIYRKTLADFDDGYKNKLYSEFYNALPKGMHDNGNKDPIQIILNTIDSEVKRLSKYGLAINDDMVTKEVSAAFAIRDIIIAYSEYRLKVVQEGISEHKESVQELYREAENSATGLSYGMIGGATDLVLYSLDNLLATRKQLKRNFSEASRQSNVLLNLKEREIDNKINEGLQLIAPKLKEATFIFVDELKDFEIKTLEESGIIDLETNRATNSKKASHYLSLISNGLDQEYNAAQALKNDPADIKIYTECIHRDIYCPQMFELAKFMGLEDQFKKAVVDEIHNVQDTEDMAKHLLNYQYCLSDNDYKRGIYEISKEVEKKIEEAAVRNIGDNYSTDTLDSFFRQQLKDFFSESIQSLLSNNNAYSALYGPDWNPETIIKRMKQFRGKIDAVITSLMNGPEKNVESLEDAIANTKQNEIILEKLLVNFRDIGNSIADKKGKLSDLDSMIKSLIDQRSNLGLFAVKEKKTIDIELAELEGEKEKITSEISQLTEQLQGYTSETTIETDLAKLKKEEKELVANQENGRVSFSYKEALKKWRDDSEIEKYVTEYLKTRKKSLHPFLAIQIASQGDIVSFGKYPQGSTEKNEPIEWIVLAKEKGRILLISKYCLERKKYNSAGFNVLWADCALRIWLRNDFYKEAFDLEEQDKLLTVVKDLDDKVFLLSTEQAKKYFNYDEERECTETPYSGRKYKYYNVDKKVEWWLRSTGSPSKEASYVDWRGIICERGNHSTELVPNNSVVLYKGVRPAIWVDIS